MSLSDMFNVVHPLMECTKENTDLCSHFCGQMMWELVRFTEHWQAILYEPEESLRMGGKFETVPLTLASFLSYRQTSNLSSRNSVNDFLGF